VRVLAVDFGSKRIGVAVGDTELKLATPRPNISASGTLATDASAIVVEARASGAAAVVVGIPGGYEDGRMERICRQLADRISDHGIPVYLIDESLTSVAAEASMAHLKASRRRKLKDSEAACLILERFFHEAGP